MTIEATRTPGFSASNSLKNAVRNAEGGGQNNEG